MIRLLRPYLRPYGRQLALVIALLLVQAIANLYLPELNANIINYGVVKGDTDYILRTGGFMLLVTALLGVASVIVVYFAPNLAVGGVIMALRQDVPLSRLLIVIIPIMAVVIGVLLRRAVPLFQAMKRKIDRINLD